MAATSRIRICIVGAVGRMGGTIIREAPENRFEVTGAVESSQSPNLGKSLKELGLRNSQTKIESAASLPDVLVKADVCISFTRAEAEVQNIQAIASSGKPVIIGTTGLSKPQMETLERTVQGKIPAVISSNFSVGANTLFMLAELIKNLPRDFDISIMEAHHSGKADAPSGTAMTLAQIISSGRGYTKNVHGRSGISKRTGDELEVVALRGGGVPGDHVLYAFGPNEMLRLEHLVFSRSTFAQGALLAAEWASRQVKPGTYTMLDVLKSDESVRK